MTRLIKVLEGDPLDDGESFPAVLEMSEARINKYWDWWVLYRASGGKIDYWSAHQMPKEALDTVFYLDDLFERLVIQKSKRKPKEEE